jgi:hypothetical protein
MPVRLLVRAYSTIDCIILRHFDLPLTNLLFLTSTLPCSNLVHTDTLTPTPYLEHQRPIHKYQAHLH